VNVSGAAENDFLSPDHDCFTARQCRGFAQSRACRRLRSRSTETREPSRAVRALSLSKARCGAPSPASRTARRCGHRLQIWSERFDRQVTDVFEVQDEITKSIVASLKLDSLW
jgi:hypothetical protein